MGAGLDAAAAVEALKYDDDAVSLLFAQLSAAYPALVGPLVHERDLYLAWSLKRSKAVGGAAAVVGVIGRGHMRGVCFALTHDAGGCGCGWVGGCWWVRSAEPPQPTLLTRLPTALCCSGGQPAVQRPGWW